MSEQAANVMGRYLLKVASNYDMRWVSLTFCLMRLPNTMRRCMFEVWWVSYWIKDVQALQSASGVRAATPPIMGQEVKSSDGGKV